MKIPLSFLSFLLFLVSFTIYLETRISKTLWSISYTFQADQGQDTDHKFLLCLCTLCLPFLPPSTTRNEPELFNSGTARRPGCIALGKSLMQFSQPQNGNTVTYLEGSWELKILCKVASKVPKAQSHQSPPSSLMQKLPKIKTRQKNIYAINIQKICLKKDTQVNLIRFWKPCHLLYFWRKVKGEEKIFTWIWGAA